MSHGERDETDDKVPDDSPAEADIPAQADVPAEPGARDTEPVVATATEAAEVDAGAADPVAADPVAADAVAADAGAAAAPARVLRPVSSRRTVVTLVTGSALLLALAVVFGIGWARTNADLADERRAHAATRDLLRAELDAVTARRTQLERDLAAAHAQALDPQSRTAIEACVREYADYERVLADLVKNGSWRAITPGAASELIIARLNQDLTPYVSTSCRDAEPHLAR